MKWEPVARVGGFIFLAIAGCTSVNRQLNPQTMALESRVRNDTRSAVFADVTPPGEGPDSPIRSERAVSPTSRPVQTPVDRDGTFVGLAISGGGSRSANFAAACMFQLQRLGMLQRVDYISTVSGGSLTGAYYCASDDKQWNPGNVQAALTYHFASDLILRTLLPWNELAFFFSDYDRSDILAGVFSDTLLSRDNKPLTFADLRADRPRLLINATDLQSGRRFVFCNETFDDLNSDLSRFPLSYAVTASAAVPVLLHPVTLRDFSTSFDQYRHLVDGGVTDNLGAQTLVDTYRAQVKSAEDHGRADPYPNGAVFIVIDAHTRFNAALSAQRDVGLLTSLKTAAGLTSTALLNRASSTTLAEIILNGAKDSETAGQLRAEIKQLSDDGFLRFTDSHDHRVRVIYVTLGQVEGLQNVPYGSFNESLNSIGTYFNITQLQAYMLYQAAELLMKEKFGARVREVMTEMPPEK